jgi:hypothetical protein
MFRRVDLPARIPGRLLLHSMPGRYEAIETVWHQVRSETIGAIVCLAEKDEIHEKSSEYARALEAGTVPCSVLPFEIPDRGAPEDRRAFWAIAVRGGRADSLRGRRRPHRDICYFCAARVGRIGEQRAERGLAGGIDR